MQIIKQLRRQAKPSTANGTASYNGVCLTVNMRTGSQSQWICGAVEARQKIANLGVKVLSFVEL